MANTTARLSVTVPENTLVIVTSAEFIIPPKPPMSQLTSREIVSSMSEASTCPASGNSFATAGWLTICSYSPLSATAPSPKSNCRHLSSSGTISPTTKARITKIVKNAAARQIPRRVRTTNCLRAAGK